MNAPSEWAEKRDRFLKECGFSDYQTYLKSSLWEFVRSQLAATESADRCIICRAATGLVWHHRRYTPAVLVGNFSVRPGSHGFVVRLCCDCHSRVHFSANGDFIADFSEVDSRLQQLYQWCRSEKQSPEDFRSRAEEEAGDTRHFSERFSATGEYR